MVFLHEVVLEGGSKGSTSVICDVVYLLCYSLSVLKEACVLRGLVQLINFPTQQKNLSSVVSD